VNRLVRGELRKLRTVRIWPLVWSAALVVTGLAFLVHAGTAHDAALTPAGWARAAATLYTSGQFFGLLFVLLLGIVVATNEYHYRTVAGTYLAAPRRARAIAAKVVVTALVAAAYWLVTTAANLVAGTLFLRAEGVPSGPGTAELARTVSVGLAGYVSWAALGVGLGTLIRSRPGAAAAGTTLYLASLPATGVADPDSPARWVSALVPLGYALVATAAGMLVVIRRDVT
jgi:hypothetical protein